MEKKWWFFHGSCDASKRCGGEGERRSKRIYFWDIFVVFLLLVLERGQGFILFLFIFGFYAKDKMEF